jgi:hypothetical protein
MPCFSMAGQTRIPWLVSRQGGLVDNFIKGARQKVDADLAALSIGAGAHLPYARRASASLTIKCAGPVWAEGNKAGQIGGLHVKN